LVLRGGFQAAPPADLGAAGGSVSGFPRSAGGAA
jgi:hypothetical protein